MLKSPFPYFGGKSKVAPELWLRFGNTPNYVEPFAGSLGALLQRPHEDIGTETVNDIDCYIANFFRALREEPEALADIADAQVNEADLHARHLWLVSRDRFRERMKIDPDFYDVKIAGWWVWGICQWIGSGWCDSKKYTNEETYSEFLESVSSQKLPHMGDAGMGIHRPSQQLPHMGNAGMGIHRPSQKLPHLGNAGRGVHEYMYALSSRLRGVRVACGDWTRVLGDSVTTKHGITGVLLDPPYSHDVRDSKLYANDNDVAPDVRRWAIANGDNPLMRIALCGYAEEHDMPDGWTPYRWKTPGGYGSQGDGTGRDNADKETIWFSPHCIQPKKQQRQASLFEMA